MSSERLKGSGRVLVVGDIMTDVLVKPEGPIVRGSDCRAAIQMMHGGSGANQAIWLGHYGVPVTFAGKVGRSDLERYESHMRSRGVTPALSVDDEAPSGMLVSIIDPDGQRSFLTSRGANDRMDIGDLPDNLLDEVALLQISGYSLVAPHVRAGVLDLAARARRRNIMISYDPASVAFLEELGPANFLEWTKGADFCFPNEAEAEALTGSPDPEMQRRRLAESYSTTVIKRGPQGAEVISGGRILSEAVPPTKARVIDTTGAGDAFLAAFLATFLSTGSHLESLRFAVVAGLEATTILGAQPAGGKSF
jgi:sugar/nucleoside kinase (ribokinase family)